MRRIAEALDRSVSTVSEEIRLGRVRNKYEPVKAHHKAYVRRREAKYQGMKIVGHSLLQDFIEKQLYDDQSPGRSGKFRQLVNSW